MSSLDLHRPFISICIPAYKRVEYLERLLQSIAIQTFRDFEVVLSDDSNDQSVLNLIENYKDQFEIKYIKNPVSLGTPENWNHAIRNATGVWIKIMHDDDWFYDSQSLGRFASVAKNSKSKFIFSAYQNVFLDENRKEDVFPSFFRLLQLKKQPATLLSKNIIGPPSVILHVNDGRYFYDNKTKWVVDIDLYIRYLPTTTFQYLKEPLICVGMSQEQVTRICSRIPEVEIPEFFYLAEKIGWKTFRNILVYDSLWRLLRNMKVRSVDDIKSSGYDKELPGFISSIISAQQFWGWRLLSFGILSKFAMLLSYFRIRNRFNS